MSINMSSLVLCVKNSLETEEMLLDVTSHQGILASAAKRSVLRAELESPIEIQLMVPSYFSACYPPSNGDDVRDEPRTSRAINYTRYGETTVVSAKRAACPVSDTSIGSPVGFTAIPRYARYVREISVSLSKAAESKGATTVANRRPCESYTSLYSVNHCRLGVSVVAQVFSHHIKAAQRHTHTHTLSRRCVNVYRIEPSILFLFLDLCICLFIYLSIYLCIYLSVHFRRDEYLRPKAERYPLALGSFDRRSIVRWIPSPPIPFSLSLLLLDAVAAATRYLPNHTPAEEEASVTFSPITPA